MLKIKKSSSCFPSCRYACACWIDARITVQSWTQVRTAFVLYAEHFWLAHSLSMRRLVRRRTFPRGWMVRSIGCWLAPYLPPANFSWPDTAAYLSWKPPVRTWAWYGSARLEGSPWSGGRTCMATRGSRPLSSDDWDGGRYKWRNIRAIATWFWLSTCNHRWQPGKSRIRVSECFSHQRKHDSASWLLSCEKKGRVGAYQMSPISRWSICTPNLPDRRNKFRV